MVQRHNRQYNLYSYDILKIDGRIVMYVYVNFLIVEKWFAATRRAKANKCYCRSCDNDSLYMQVFTKKMCSYLFGNYNVRVIRYIVVIFVQLCRFVKCN